MIFQERYKYNPNTDLLGKGGFARVYKATDTLLDREVAIKVFNATDKGQYTVIEEIKKAIRLQHPNLLRYYDVAVVENTNALGETDTLQIGVMELANAGDLKQYARKHPNSPLLFALLQQVLSGLEYLHSKGIIHRDLKPQNILLVEEDGELTAKISDFGISKHMDSGTNSASMAIGTIEYMAPEQFSPGKYGINGKIGTNVDLWSFGIMVHELLTDQPLFGQRNGNTTAEQIMNAILSQTLPPDIESLPEPYRAVVKKCLVSDANQRIQKAKELIGLLHENENTPDSAETVQLDKEMLRKANYVPNETIVVPKRPVEPQAPVPPPEPVPTEAERKSTMLKYFVLLMAVSFVIACFFWYKQYARKSEARDHYNYGMGHAADKGKDADTTAFLIGMKGAEALGNDSARFKLADFYLQQNNIAAAAPFIEKLIDTVDGNVVSNFPAVMAMHAQVLSQVKQENNKAMELLQNCAEAGNPDCAYQLGMAYYEGKIVPQNYTKALKWFEREALYSNDKAETMLGNMYIMGQGVEQNNGKAINYYFKAADQGNAVAMYALGLAYANGTGVEKDREQAVRWFNKVLNAGKNASVVNAAKQQLINIKN